MEYLLLFLFIFLIYKLFTASRKTYVENKQTYKVLPMSAFDAYLIQHHQKSLKEAEAIPTVVPNLNITVNQPKPIVEEPLRDEDWIDDLYLGMLASGKYDDAGLRKEAMEALNITALELDEMVEQYKKDKKKKKR